MSDDRLAEIETDKISAFTRGAHEVRAIAAQLRALREAASTVVAKFRALREEDHVIYAADLGVEVERLAAAMKVESP